MLRSDRTQSELNLKPTNFVVFKFQYEAFNCFENSKHDVTDLLPYITPPSHIHTHTFIQTHTHSCTDAHTHMQTPADARLHACAYTLKHTHAQMRTHTQLVECAVVRASIHCLFEDTHGPGGALVVLMVPARNDSSRIRSNLQYLWTC